MKHVHTGPMGVQFTKKVHNRYPEKLMSAKVERRSPLNGKRRFPQTAKASARSK